MILVAYASKHGSTAGIARAIADRLNALGGQAEAVPVGQVDRLEEPEAVVLGSAVYAGSWMKDALGFAQRHRDELAARPLWLFSSGPLAGAPKDPEPKQLPELEAGLKPRGHRVFAGALDASSLSFAERLVVKAVKAEEGDFRDWDEIAAWADEIAGALDLPAAR